MSGLQADAARNCAVVVGTFKAVLRFGGIGADMRLLLSAQDRRDAGAVQAIFLLRSSPEDGSEVRMASDGSRWLGHIGRTIRPL